MTRILHIEDTYSQALDLNNLLEMEGYSVDWAENAEDGLRMLAIGNYDVVALDRKIPATPGSVADPAVGDNVMDKLKREAPFLPKIMITGEGGEPVARDVLTGDRFSRYVIKDTDGIYLNEIPLLIERLLQERQQEHDRILQDKDLAESERLYRWLIDNSQDVVLKLDEDFNTQFVSQSVTEVIGYSVEEFKLLKFVDTFTDNSKGKLRLMMARLMSERRAGNLHGMSVELEQNHKDRSRSPRRVEVTLKVGLDNDDRKPLFWGILKDITDREASRLARISEIFSPYLVEEVVKNLMDDVDLAPTTKILTVLVCDMRNSTRLTECLGQPVVQLIGRFMDVMAEVINKYSGNLNTFAGDGIVALFGAPNELKQHSENAVIAALEMQEEIAKINGDFGPLLDRYNLPPLQIGIGIDAGELFVGAIGSGRRKKYTALGTVINRASRIEAETKTRGDSILITEAVLQNLTTKCRDSLELGDARLCRLRGLEDEDVRLYPVKGFQPIT